MNAVETLKSSRETTADAFLDGRLTVLQPKKGPRAAIDALFLAAAIPAEEGKAHSVLEAGTGSGIAALALCSRINDCRITGVDVQRDLLALARENASVNGFEHRVSLIEADIGAPCEALEVAGLKREGYHHVAANPPFFTRGRSREQADASTARAYTAHAGDLEKWVRFLTTMTAPRGTLTLIHRAEALEELLALLKGRFGALAVFPLFPRQGTAAKRLLIQGLKGSRASLEMLPGMVLHKADGSYTEPANHILRGGAGLHLRARA